MFSTFQTEHGTLIVRTESLRTIEDRLRLFAYPSDQDNTPHCFVDWLFEDGEIRTREVLGTAAENYARLQAEELRLIEAAAERQRRYDGGLPLMPVPRGRAGR